MNVDTINLMGQQIPVAILLVYLQNWLKKQSWFPLLSYESSGRLNNIAAVILSGLGTLGVSVSHTGGPLTGGIVSFAIPALPIMLTGVWHWMTQYAWSKLTYHQLQDKLNPVSTLPPIPVVPVVDPDKPRILAK
jgi:hypothetical protein